MGSRKRARDIAAAVLNPIIARAADHALTNCGNCLHRVDCSKDLIDFKRLFPVMETLPEPLANPTEVQKDIARLVKRGCGQCDMVPSCLAIWCNETGMSGESYTKILNNVRAVLGMGEEAMTGTIAQWMDSAGIELEKLLPRAGKKWLMCELTGKAETSVLRCQRNGPAIWR